MKKTNALFLALFMAAAASAAGCGEGNAVTSQSRAATASSPDTYPFVMGATNIVVGTISVWNDATNLYVKYDMLPGYSLAEAHVCASLTAFAWTPPGQCPYQQDPYTQTFTIPLSDLGIEGPGCGMLIYLQVHAAILDANLVKVGSAYAGTFKGRVAYEITCDPQEVTGCTYTQGFWKTHPSAWPVPGLTIGGVYYTKTQLIKFLGTAPKGDASIIMGHQLVAALLNVASGATTNPEVTQALADAEAWMTANKDADGTLPYGIKAVTSESLPNPAVWDQAINIGAVLDLFNNGFDGPPHC